MSAPARHSATPERRPAGSARPRDAAVLRVSVGAGMVAVVVGAGFLLTAVPGWDVREARVDAAAVRAASPTVHAVALVLAAVFEPEVVVLLGLALALGVALTARRVPPATRVFRGAVVLALVGIPSVATEGIKRVVERPRPDLAALHVVAPESWSYPSGHTAGATALTLTLVFLLGRTGSSRRMSMAARASGLVLVIAVAASRVVLGVHYPTDTIAAVVATSGVFLVVRTLVVHRLVLPPGSSGGRGSAAGRSEPDDSVGRWTRTRSAGSPRTTPTPSSPSGPRATSSDPGTTPVATSPAS